ncbi:alpha/beta fold hydrolase [Streptomyces sp. TLI_146]|uniref:alpha/beta fold hydrolase n=1 Tax=Streptomyces sp. TLI_146 TaxID=1938858 RepID=UPI000C6FF52C|nr:alpha/beta fold hydrolase [Streptomyces sp. TLI_146]PKV90039.1 acetyl esterase/lipase [Streptomyces sp. TLI_146]
MTAFILVSGTFTGAYVWKETAARLTAAGAEAHAVTLTGLGERRAAAGPGTDLETHIADVLAAIDAVGADRDLVLVGHDYGIHPVLGAADRRAGRIERIVYVDAGMPMDGLPALAAVPDQALRDELTRLAELGGEAATGLLPAPADAAEWQRWGSTAGVAERVLEELTQLAAPQPLATLLQPLRLTGAVAAVPTSAVLCSGNGAGIELVQNMVNLGHPALQAFVDPRVSFFELPTGHWPMLSMPAELADALLAAAAGQGHRLSAASAELPAHLRPFPLDVPDVPRERTGNVDLYVPATTGNEPLPAVLFVHGGPVPADTRPTPRDWPMYAGYARLAAGQGVVSAVLDHRLHDLADYPLAEQDVRAAVDLLRTDPRVDADRIALWFFSGGGPLCAPWLGAPPVWLRCLAATYPVMAPLPNWGFGESRFRPADAVRAAGDLPIVLTRVGLEMAEIAATVEEFLAEARHCGAEVEVVDVPNGHHGFETRDPGDESREAVQRALHSVLAHLWA